MGLATQASVNSQVPLKQWSPHNRPNLSRMSASLMPANATAMAAAMTLPPVNYVPVPYSGAIAPAHQGFQQQAPVSFGPVAPAALDLASFSAPRKSKSPVNKPSFANLGGLLKVKSAEQTTASEEEGEFKSILKQRPLRYIGFMNEFAQAIGKKILGPVYNAMWAGEYVYMTADSLIDARHQYKQDSSSDNKKKLTRSGKEFLNTAIWQALATVFLPTYIIDKGKDLSEVAFKKMKGGLLGIPQHKVEKWGPVGVGLALIPPLTYVVDPAIKFATDHTVRPLLGLPIPGRHKAQQPKPEERGNAIWA